MNNNINNEFDNKMSQILYYQLALENYEDYTHNFSKSLHNTWDKLSYLRKNVNSCSKITKNQSIFAKF